jgi:hypothetical protein
MDCGMEYIMKDCVLLNLDVYGWLCSYYNDIHNYLMSWYICKYRGGATEFFSYNK